MEKFQYWRNTQRCGGNKEEIWKIENLNLEYKKRQRNKNLLSVHVHHTAQRGMHFVILGILLYFILWTFVDTFRKFNLVDSWPIS